MKKIIFAFFFLFFLYPIFPPTVFAEHCENNPDPNVPLGSYCENATKTIWQDLPCSQNPPHTPLKQCSANEDCEKYQSPSGSGQQLSRCVPIGTGSTYSTPGNFGPDAAGLTQIEAVFSRVISLFVGGAFVALFVVLVWAGIKFLTSGGDPKALEAARNTVTWALLGILFLAIAWLILQLIAAFTGIEGLKTFDVGKLCIPPVNLGNCVPKNLPAPSP